MRRSFLIWLLLTVSELFFDIVPMKIFVSPI